MLVLLVIFMVTAPLIVPGEMQLPSVGSKLTTPISPLKIYVKRDLSLTLQEGATPPSPVSRDALVARIIDRQAKNSEQAVVIYADGDVPYKAVMGVLDMLQTNRIGKVGLMARPQP
jgi:biopolymer transport protein TolR